MTNRVRKALAHLVYLPRTLRLIWSASPGWTTSWLVILLLQGLVPAAVVYLTSQLVNSLAAVSIGGISTESLGPIVVPAAGVVALLLITLVLEHVGTWVRTAQSELVFDRVSALLQTKSIEVDLAFYETPAHHDHLHRARSNAGQRSLALLDGLGSLLQNGVTMLAMVSLLLPYGVWVPAVLVLSTLPVFLVVLQTNQRYHSWWEQTTVDQRWQQYYETMLTGANTAAELRLFKLGPHFQSAFQDVRQGLRSGRLKLVRDQSFAQLGAGLVSLLMLNSALVVMVWRLLQGQITLGDLTLFYQALNWGQGVLRGMLSSIGQIFSNSLFLGNLYEFLDLRPRIVDPAAPATVPARLQQGVRFRQVTFRYPGSERIALHNFDLTIPAGKTVAIVGVNGAGKSTLLKLLCRFYDPEIGRIELDGIDIRDISVAQLRRMISVLFQMPVSYQATAAESIALGDLEAAPSAAAIEAAAHSAGAHEVIAKLPKGYSTLLGKAFAEGTDLSGGEWQRVALARAFLRKAEIVILDEPTSFMDSWAEAEWLDRFRTLVSDRTAVVITHRFTTAMRADIIHVMDDGKIVESGTHAELLALGGMYARSWEAQMRASLAPVPDTFEIVAQPVTQYATQLWET